MNRIAVSRKAAAFATDIARRTRPAASEAPEWVRRVIDWGAGPRAGQSMLRTAKALAAMDGRPAIANEDIREVALPVLRHRLGCNFRARAEGLDEDKVVEKIMAEVKEP